LQKFSAWCGIIAIAFFFGGIVIAGFFPVLSPALTPEQLAEIYQGRQARILTGGLLVVIASAFVAPFATAIFMQLRRMEGPRPVGAYSQLASGIANVQFFIFPGLLFVATAYRPDRPLDSLSTLNDLTWVITMLPWSVGAMQCTFIGLALVIHGSRTTPYPRWLGFFNIWIAIGMASSCVIPFFKTGPFAWNGLVGFWIPATVVGLWMIVMVWMTLRAIDTDTDTEIGADTPTLATAR